MPKGVIHHLHWSASFDYKSIYDTIEEFLKAEENNADRTVVISVKLYLEDVTIGGVKNEKHLVKYFLTKQKYLDSANQDSTVEAHQDKLNSFKKNVSDDGKCLNFLKDKAGFDPNTLDSFVRGFFYWKSCDGKIFDNEL